MKSVFIPKELRMIGQKIDAKILLVDDEDYNLTALKIILRYHIKLDVEKFCEEAVNGQEALNAVQNSVIKSNYKSCQYELILMDCNMPKMDGYVATDLIRKFIKDSC